MRRAAARRAALGAVASLLALLAGEPAASAADRIELERVRYVGTVRYSRVVVDLSAPAEYTVQSVPAQPALDVPERLVVDFSGAVVGPEAREPLRIGDALLRGIRTGQFAAETARLVLDFAEPAEADVFTLPDPYRLIIDLRKQGVATEPPPGATTEVVRRDTGRERSPPPVRMPSREPPKAPPEAPGRVAPEEKRFRVVLDPGHGGKDPGATGVRGILEKDLVLSISQLVAKKLAKVPGIEVSLTREDDRYLGLEERTGLANAAGADLFVSIHGNASANASSRGIEVYYLNNTNNRGTLRLAAIENGLQWDPENPKLQSAIPDLSYILSDLRQTYKVEESRQLAESIGRTMVERVSDRWDDVVDLGAKEGPFYVLVGAYMPCVLVEVSFLTHPVEGARLATREYRRALADGIADGITRYVARAQHAKTL